jgi:hypothetical protein
MSPEKFYHLERNRLLLLFKLYESSTLRRALPALLLTEIATWTFALRRGPAYVAARWRGYAWLWRQRSHWRHARRAVQCTRVPPDAQVLAGALSGLPFEQIVNSRALAALLSRVTTPLYHAIRRAARIGAPL